MRVEVEELRQKWQKTRSRTFRALLQVAAIWGAQERDGERKMLSLSVCEMPLWGIHFGTLTSNFLLCIIIRATHPQNFGNITSPGEGNIISNIISPILATSNISSPGHMLEAVYYEPYPEDVQPVTEPRDFSQAKYGAGTLRPTWELDLEVEVDFAGMTTLLDKEVAGYSCGDYLYKVDAGKGTIGERWIFLVNATGW